MRLEFLLAALALCGCATPEPTTTPREARELAGRVPGPTQRCVAIVSSQSLRVSDSDTHTLLYGNGRIIWANDLGPSCGLGVNDLLITEPIGSEYCRGDIVRTVDRYTRIPGPACVLGNFVPFSR